MGVGLAVYRGWGLMAFGAVGDGCSCYPVGSTHICYGGPAGTENVGACRAGT